MTYDHDDRRAMMSKEERLERRIKELEAELDVAWSDDEENKLRTQLSATEAKLAEAQLENRAWEALVFSATDLDISRSCCDGMHEPGGKPRAYVLDTVSGHDCWGDTAGAAAVGLAQKLGLVEKAGG